MRRVIRYWLSGIGAGLLLGACGPSAGQMEGARLARAVEETSAAAAEARAWAEAVDEAEKRLEPDYQRKLESIEAEFEAWPTRGAAESDRRDRLRKEAYEDWQARAEVSAKAALGKR